jgi:secreted trypsin-like serine protease
MFQGDEGGALVVWRNNVWIQIGIFGEGPVNCAVGNPALYTRVTSFLTWIRDNTGVGY